MIKNLIGGIAVGIANAIPGVSGGTMMVVLGIFNQMMSSISDIFKRENPHRMKDFIFLFQVLIGAAIGLVGFAKILEFLFNYYPTQTIYWFIGLVVFSIPLFIKKEMSDKKFNWFALVAGMALIFLIQYLNPSSSNVIVNPEFPALNIVLCIQMIFIGIIGGFSMLLPGISGSMVLLIIGQYYLFKSYLANVTTFRLDILIPLGFMAIGILIGIILSAKITKFCLEANKTATLSFLLGLIIASSLVLIPFSATYDMMILVTSFIAFAVGGILVSLLSKIN